MDEPGVLASVASVFGANGVSIQSMEQSGVGDEARLSFLTHEALTKNVRETILDLARLDAVDSIGACLRVIERGES
jgi:homoserine dehydrogenase